MEAPFLGVHAEFEISAHTRIRTFTSGGFEAGVRLVRLRPPEFALLPRQKESKDWLTFIVWALAGLWHWEYISEETQRWDFIIWPQHTIGGSIPLSLGQ